MVFIKSHYRSTANGESEVKKSCECTNLIFDAEGKKENQQLMKCYIPQGTTFPNLKQNQ